MTKKEDFKHDKEGFNEKFTASSTVKFAPFVNSPVKDVLVSIEQWRASDHRVVIDLPKNFSVGMDGRKIADIIVANSWFLRSVIPTILRREQSYNEKTKTSTLKLAGYGMTGLTPPAVNLAAWAPGSKKPSLYPSTIGPDLNKYMHLFTVPSTGKSTNSRTAVANHVAMNKVDKWIDGELFSPTTSAIATYVIAAGLMAVDENTQLNRIEIEKAILNSDNAVEYLGAIATVVLHGVSRWHNPGEWSTGLKTVQVKSSSNNSLNRGLRITNHKLNNYTAWYVNSLLSDLPNALSYQMQRALRAVEWDGTTINDNRKLSKK